MGWIELKKISKKALAEARKQIHHAVQLPAITGRCLNPADQGDNFAALFWDKEQKILSGQRWEESDFRCGLKISDFALVVLKGKNEIKDSLKLDGKTYIEAFDWISRKVGSLGFDPKKLNIKLPYKIPEYPTANGVAFKFIDYNAFLEIQNYYSNAELILENIAKENDNISEVRCWPHHFDIAFHINVGKKNNSEKSIGVGMSPGDESYNEPYFYISPWPYPEEISKLPPLTGGAFWNTNGWVGAVLTSTTILNSFADQEKMVFKTVYKTINEFKKILFL